MTRESYAARYTPADEQDLIAEARRKWKNAESSDVKQRERELEDLQFFDGRQWPDGVKNARQGTPGLPGVTPVPPRPTITIDKIREPIRQVLNAERQADLGITIAPVDDFGAQGGIADAEIQLREGIVRRIQRESQAQDARSWAFARAAIAGRGYYRVMTRYLPGKTFDQDIYVDRIYNQASVLLDPAHEQPDGSDAEYGFIATDVPWSRYQMEYGRIGERPNLLATASSGEWRALGDELPEWFLSDEGNQPKAVRVVEYWYREPQERTLYQLHDGRAVYADEGDIRDGHYFESDGAVGIPLGVDDNGDPTRRTVIDTKICWVKMDGVQVLEKTDWPGRYIPIIKVIGEEIQPYDSQRRAIGMVRPVRDAQRMYNAMVSKMVEKITFAPNAEWIIADGADEGFEDEYMLSASRMIPAVHYNPYDDGGRPLPPPQRQVVVADVASIAGVVGMFDQNMSALLAAPPEPRMGNIDTRVKTARGLQQLLETAQQGTSHLLDNLQRSIRYEGLIINDLLPAIYNRDGRIVRMMKAGGDTEAVTLGAPVPGGQPAMPSNAMPGAMPGAMPQGLPGQPAPMLPGMPMLPAPPPQAVYTLTPGASFNVTISVGRNFQTRRQEQESLITGLLQAEPQLMGVYGDLLFKYSDAPGHEELQKRAEVMLAPPIQALLKGGPQLDPQQQALMAENQQLKMLLQNKTPELQTKAQIAQMQEQAESERAALDREERMQETQLKTAATMATMQAKVDAENFRSYVDALETRIGKALDLHLNRVTQHLTQAHEAATQGRQHQHERDMAAQQQLSAAMAPAMPAETPAAPEDGGAL